MWRTKEEAAPDRVEVPNLFLWWVGVLLFSNAQDDPGERELASCKDLRAEAQADCCRAREADAGDGGGGWGWRGGVSRAQGTGGTQAERQANT